MADIAKKNNIEELALTKIKEYQDLGLVLPEGFNPTNSLKKARFILNDMKVSGKPVLEVCTKESIIQCLLESVTKGLSYDSSQIYFIPRGNQMTNMESVYGRIVRAKRASKNYRPVVGYVYEGDEFEIGHNLENGEVFIKKHESKLENLDKPIIAAYTYVTDNDGHTNVFIMTKREWLTSWKKSPNGCVVAKEFEKDMIFRTIIKKSTKALVNSVTTNIVTVSDNEDEMLAGDAPVIIEEQSNGYAEFDDVTDDTPVEKEPNPVKEEQKSNDDSLEF